MVGAALGFSDSSDRQGLRPWQPLHEGDSKQTKSARSAPQARPWGARALLRAGRRGDEAKGEDSMLSRRLAAVNAVDVLAIHGDSWQQRSSAGSIVADDATLIDAGRLSGLLKALSRFIQWPAVHGDARWGL